MLLKSKPIFTDFAPNETFLNSSLALFELIKSDKKTLERKTKKLLKKYLKVNSAEINFFFTARAGLFNLLKALNLKKGDEVLVQGFTCSTVILPLLQLGLVPKFVDIETTTFSFDPIDLKKKITKRTKAVILQHTYGFTPAKRSKIISIIRKTNLLLIEDIAHTIKPIKFDYDQKKQFYLLSFGRSKALSSVFGGAIVSKNKRVGEKLKKIELSLSSPETLLLLKVALYKLITPLIKKTYSLALGKAVLKAIKPIFPPEISKKEKTGKFNEQYNKQFSKLQLAFLLKQLEEYEKIKNERIKIANWLLKNLSKKFLPEGLKEKRTIKEPIIRFPILKDNREKLLKKLKRQNIFLGSWYYKPIIGIEDIEKLGYKPGACPKAEELAKKIISLPVTPEIETQMLNFILKPKT